MNSRFPEKNKKPGVYYAFTDDGVELPVIDITSPMFAENASQKELAALSEGFLRLQKMPLFIRHFLMRHSVLGRGMKSDSDGFLKGMTTYVVKLRPEVLGKGYAGLIDRKVAGAIGSVSFRRRLQGMARLIADRLVSALRERKRTCVHLLSIGGGPTMDILNSLILIQKENPGLLTGRHILIRVFDLDEIGPHFGANALTSLSVESGPLHGIDITLDHISYDWAHVSMLRETIGRIDAYDVAICSSEGALFEYGSNEVIAENLKVLRETTPAFLEVIGSIVCDNNISQAIGGMSTVSFRTFELDDFHNLALSVGWTVGRVLEVNPLYWIVMLKKA